jgi:ketol-acid reductoisomerase
MSNDHRFFSISDVPDSALSGEQVAILGYGNLGRTVALNLRDSGVQVLIGNREDDYAAQAKKEGFEVVSVPEAAKADVVFVLLPDEVIPDVWSDTIAPALSDGAAIAFGSGYTLAYDLIDAPRTVDVLLVAPRMAGETARERFERGEGFWAYIGVENDASGKAERRMLGLAAGMGSLRAGPDGKDAPGTGALQMTAEMEATIDLYIEQTVGPLLGAAIMTAFEVGTQAGIPGPALVLEMYMSGEFETVFAAFRNMGFFKASESHGPTALFGGMMRTMEVDRAPMVERFQKVLSEIREGDFAKKFQEERANGYPMLKAAELMIQADSPQTQAEGRVRQRG